MIIKKVTYTDYMENERTEELRFNLSEAELTEMELTTTGGLGEYIKKITAAQDAPAMIALFKDLVLKSYGEVSPDGRRFIKNDKIREEFSQTPAYSKIFMELAFDADAAANFIKGVIPKDMADKLPADLSKVTN